MHSSPTAKEDVGFHSTSTSAVLGKQVMVKDEGMRVVISCLTICDVGGTVLGGGSGCQFFLGALIRAPLVRVMKRARGSFALFLCNYLNGLLGLPCLKFCLEFQPCKINVVTEFAYPPHCLPVGEFLSTVGTCHLDVAKLTDWSIGRKVKSLIAQTSDAFHKRCHDGWWDCLRGGSGCQLFGMLFSVMYDID